MTKQKKLRGMISAMTATAVLYAMPAGFAAEAQMQNVLAMEASAQTTPAAASAQTAPATAGTQVNRSTTAQTEVAKPFAVVRAGKKWGAVAPSGNLAIPAEYDQITSYSADAVAVRQSKTWGIVRMDGTVIIPPTYDEVRTHQYTTDSL